MNFHEPTQGNLKTLCGWALARQAVASPEDKEKLQRFLEAADDVIPLAQEEEVVFAVERPAEMQPVVRRSYRQVPPDEMEVIRVLESVRNPLPVAQDVCHHKFNINTQICMFCGKTYREAKGRKPELMS